MPEVKLAWGPAAKGAKFEGVGASSKNTGLFAAMKEAGNIFAAFSGHDHNNDFIAEYEGITIGYARKSGYGGYKGSMASHSPGSRIVEVSAMDGSFSWDTWIRLETGEKCAQTEQGQTCGSNATEPEQCSFNSYVYCCGVGTPCDCGKGTISPGQCSATSYLYCCSLGKPCDCSRPSASLASVTPEMRQATEMCRNHDDPSSCRIASGMRDVVV